MFSSSVKGLLTFIERVYCSCGYLISFESKRLKSLYSRNNHNYNLLQNTKYYAKTRKRNNLLMPYLI